MTIFWIIYSVVVLLSINAIIGPRRSHYLTATWSLVPAQDLECEHGKELEDYLVDCMATEIRNEIDAAVLNEIAGIQMVTWQMVRMPVNPFAVINNGDRMSPMYTGDRF